MRTYIPDHRVVYRTVYTIGKTNAQLCYNSKVVISAKLFQLLSGSLTSLRGCIYARAWSAVQCVRAEWGDPIAWQPVASPEKKTWMCKTAARRSQMQGNNIVFCSSFFIRFLSLVFLQLSCSFVDSYTADCHAGFLYSKTCTSVLSPPSVP